MKWVLRSLDNISEVSDEFIVECFRLRLHGRLLMVDAEEESDDELLSAARDVAARYTAVLQKHIPGLMNLMTFEEFASMPPQVITVRGATTAERTRLKNAVRRARNEFLTAGESCLRQCYDYIEQANEDENNCLFHLYKFVETLEDALGGEAKLISALNMKKAIKALKRLANDPLHDARHAPKVSGEVRRLSAQDRAAALNHAHQILRAYEGYIRLANRCT
ncbi:MAG: hypothetical protein ACRD2L_04385 [Terriglobia bacterium]